MCCGKKNPLEHKDSETQVIQEGRNVFSSKPPIVFIAGS